MQVLRVVLGVVGLLASLSSGDARAQQLQPPQPQQPQRRSPEWAMERLTRERWMHAAQLPKFTSFGEGRTFLEIDSIRPDGILRRMDITLQRTATGRDSAIITSDDAGRVVKLDAGFSPLPEALRLRMDDVADRFRRITTDGRMTLPAPRVWDLVVTFPRNPQVGARWTDTIAQTTTDARYAQTVSGRRTSRIAGDTMIDGLRLWIVRDSALITFEQRHPEQESSVGTPAEVSRTVRGVVRGFYLYDPVSQLAHRRGDTAMLSGEAFLRYSDGRVLRTPARYERFRTWQLHDSIQYKARREALRQEAMNRGGGMVIVAQSDAQRRLQQGDSALRDSLLSAWERSANGDEVRELHQTLQWWARADQAWRRRLDSIRIALGDSAHLYTTLYQRAYSSGPFSVDDARAMIPYLADPGKAWALNASRDYLYFDLAQGMTIWPLAAPGPRGRTACSPDACSLLATYYRTAREPRLRDVALVALFTADPAVWADTVLRLAGPAHPLLQSAAAIAAGVGANWTAAAKLPMPAPDSDWRTWLQWMDGRDPAYVRQQVAMQQPGARFPIDTTPRARFEESHRTALRMYMARTNRDITSELRAGYARATNDTALLVFGTLLDGLDALELTETQLSDAFSSGEPGRLALARRVLLRGFTNRAEPMPDSLAAPLVDRLLGVVIDTVPLWRNLMPDARPRMRPAPELHARRGRVSLSAANLPPATRDKWAVRVDVITPDRVRGGDLREQAVSYTVAPVVRFGRFVRLTISASEQMARRADQSPVLYASGTTYYLMQLGDEWVIVSMDGWVT